MRKNFLLMLALTTLGLSAIAQKNDRDNDGKRQRIEGSGNVITKDIAVKSFDHLTANGVFSLQLSQGDKEALKIEGEDNLIDLIVVKNDGSSLEISMKKRCRYQYEKENDCLCYFQKFKKHVPQHGWRYFI